MCKCVVCGGKTNKYICDACKDKTDIETLCDEIIAYRPGVENNPKVNQLWEEIAKKIAPDMRFSEIAFELADNLESPRREYQKIHSFAHEYEGVNKAYRERLYNIYKSMDVGALPEYEAYRVKGLVMEALLADYRYEEADEMASELIEMVDLPWQVYSLLADFYNKTRRYDISEQILDNAFSRFKGDPMIERRLNTRLSKCNDYRKAAETGKKEYIPNPKEGKDEAIAAYCDFMSSLGIDVNKPEKNPTPLPKDTYPEMVIVTKPDFDSFVAYDFETTGFSAGKDSIIEFGAVKVVNGKVVESKEFIFSEFAKPYKASLKDIISEITGITKDDLKDARKMWDVTKDFMDFVGDDILVGYNNAAFDSNFLARAGRYANIVIENPNFDVLQYVRQHKEQLGYTESDTKLGTVAKFCGVENPSAHRAWADALTTAKVYLKLKEMM